MVFCGLGQHAREQTTIARFNNQAFPRGNETPFLGPAQSVSPFDSPIDLTSRSATGAFVMGSDSLTAAAEGEPFLSAVFAIVSGPEEN